MKQFKHRTPKPAPKQVMVVLTLTQIKVNWQSTLRALTHGLVGDTLHPGRSSVGKFEFTLS